MRHCRSLLAATLTLSLASVCLALPLTAQAAERFVLDRSHTAIGFLIEHVGFSSVLGRFTDFDGAFVYDENTRRLEQLVVRVRTASVSTDDEARDAHVRKRDFLDTARYPEMIFRADGVTLDENNGGGVTGTLELLGMKLPLQLQVTLNKAAVYPFGHKRYTYGFSARGSLLRSAFGMDYGVANGLVGDEVTLIIEAEAPQAN